MDVVNPPTAATLHRRTFLIKSVLVAAAIVCALSVWSKGRGYKTWVFRHFNRDYGVHHYVIVLEPTVVRTRPANREGNILPAEAFVAADVELPYRGKVVDGASLTDAAVHLYRTIDHQAVPSVVNTSGAGDAIVLKPVCALSGNTQYTFEVTNAAKDTGGHSFRPYKATFWTAAGQRLSDFPIAFRKQSLANAQGHMFTCVTIGPDHCLYATTLTGHIFRYSIAIDGTLGPPTDIQTILRAAGGSRLVTGLTFDPSATADHLVAWVSHGQLPGKGEKGQGYIDGAEDWTGTITRIEGPELASARDVVVSLPRGWKDHLNNQIAFGPDGALYFCQAANTAMGAPDHKWGFRTESLLTAAILRLDVIKAMALPGPLSVKTCGNGAYDPFAADAPLTIYATGVRNSFDLVWHSNGRLYAGINGSAAGGNTPASPMPNQSRSVAFMRDRAASEPANVPSERVVDGGNYQPNAPEVPALTNVPETEDDVLFKIERGGYYGHPNPSRAEYVLNGANPFPNANAYQVHAYPLGTLPDPNWRPAILSFGKNLSPCGAIEYYSNVGHGALRHTLLYVRYSGGDDIIALALDKNGDVVESITGIDGFGRFINPVDLVEEPTTGNLYVAEFGGKRITLLRPIPDDSQAANAVSHRTCRMQFNLTAVTAR